MVKVGKLNLTPEQKKRTFHLPIQQSIIIPSTSQHYDFKCLCCDKRTTFTDYDEFKGEIWHFGYDKYKKCFSDFLCHLKAKIRLSGDVKHIRLLIKLFGNKETYKILSIMAKKNILVAQRLVKIVKELKEKKGKLNDHIVKKKLIIKNEN